MTEQTESILKCDNCGGEWSMIEPVSDNVYCPFCGCFDGVIDDEN